MSGLQLAQQREQEQAKLRAAQLARMRQTPARGKPSLLNTAGNQALAAKVDPRTRSTWLRGRVFAMMGQGPKGFAVDRWTLAIAEPVDGLDTQERNALNGVIQRAVFESESRYSHYFEGSIQARVLEIPLQFPLSDLGTDTSRGLLAFHIGDLLRATIQSTRGIEQQQESDERSRLRFAPQPGKTVEQERARETGSLQEEMARMRREMKAGQQEQSAVQTRLAQFAALVAISPEPDPTGWQAPEAYLRMAETALAQRDPRGANMFMDVARVTLKSQQDWWDRYKHASAFGDEVLGPVFWQAFSLFSLGIVDESLFDEFAEASKKDIGENLWIIVSTILGRVGNVITFGGYEGWKAGVERRIEGHPNDPLWELMIEATPDAIDAIIDAMLPLQEAATLAGTAHIDKATGKPVVPDFWARVQAFFSAVLKLAVLHGMAKGGGAKNKAPERRGGGLEREATKKSGTPPQKEGGTAAEDSAAGEPAAQEKAAPEAEQRSPAAERDTDPSKQPARSPERGERKASKKKGPHEITTPDSHPNVLLKGVTIEQFKALMTELKNSTDAGREIAKRIDSGELHITLDAEHVTKKASGLAVPKEVHVVWGESIQETASTTIHEGVHQADPALSDGSARSEVEARARVYEYEYRALRKLKAYDAPEDIYRSMLEKAEKAGKTRPEALEIARKSMIDMMRADPKLYGIEPAPPGGSKGPAQQPSKSVEAAKTRSQYEAENSALRWRNTVEDAVEGGVWTVAEPVSAPEPVQASPTPANAPPKIASVTEVKPAASALAPKSPGPATTAPPSATTTPAPAKPKTPGTRAEARQYLDDLRKAEPKSGSFGEHWDYERFPDGPGRRWQPGDPVDMPNASGHPGWATVRNHIWRNLAHNELEARKAGKTVRDTSKLLDADPVQSLTDAELESMRKTGEARPGFEIEHQGIPQRVAAMIEAAGLPLSEAQRLAHVGDPANLFPTTRDIHAVLDEEAASFRDRNPNLPAALDDRTANPLGSMTDAQVRDLLDALARHKIDLNKTPEGRVLRDALRHENARRGNKLPVP
jgi:hypothetical protein